MIVPALISTLRKSSKEMSAGLSVGCVMGSIFCGRPVFPETAEDPREARAQSDGRFKPIHHCFSVPELAIERGHCSRQSSIVVLEPDAQRVDRDLGQSQFGDI